MNISKDMEKENAVIDKEISKEDVACLSLLQDAKSQGEKSV